MTQALVELSEGSNRVLNIVKAMYNLKDKSEAVEIVIKHFTHCIGEPELRPEFIERIQKAEKGKFISVSNFAKRYGLE
ncbi:MAG TPA: DUF2683 family protein [Candidatus Nanoarchaeia archaeon]|nr:DUF2683 family protein [Candidatus Nanoarchaeia archaeon]